MIGFAAGIDRSDGPTNIASVLDLLERPVWFARAACRGMDTEAWFPGRGGDSRTAKAVCEGCPVRCECAAYGVNERFGIWGGASDRERRRLRRPEASSASSEVQQRSALYAWRRSEEARDLRAQRAELAALLYLDGVKPAEIGRLVNIATRDAQHLVRDALRQLSA